MKGQHSSKGRRPSSNRIFIIIIALLLVVIAVLVFIMVKSGNKPSEQLPGGTEQTEQNEPVDKLTDGIDLPGYGWFNLKADALEQSLKIPNPEQNFCYIKASILLEDGTLLWASDLIEPGKESENVVLAQTLSKGEYTAILKYECFQMDEELTPLNGATAQTLLKVY